MKPMKRKDKTSLFIKKADPEDIETIKRCLSAAYMITVKGPNMTDNNRLNCYIFLDEKRRSP